MRRKWDRETKQAIDYHNQDLSIAKELGERFKEGMAYGNLDNAYRGLGDFQQAMDYHNRALSFARELGQQNQEGIACCSLGDDYLLSGDLQKALNYYRCSVNAYNEVRGLLQSEDTWKITSVTHVSIPTLHSGVFFFYLEYPRRLCVLLRREEHRP